MFFPSLCDHTQRRDGRRARCIWRYFATARFKWPSKLTLLILGITDQKTIVTCYHLVTNSPLKDGREMSLEKKKLVEQRKVENHTFQLGFSGFLLGQVRMLHEPFSKWRGIRWNKME